MSVFKIGSSKSLDFVNSLDEWRKWRIAYEGGRVFTDTFLVPFSKRESPDDFDVRRRMSYNPAFAEAGINDFKNSIYQRMTDIKRLGGSDAYQSAMKGKAGGVDGYGCSMNTFMGQKILPELLPIGKVGIMVDKRPSLSPYKSKANNPYLYYYCAEDIWNYDYIMGDDGEQIFYNLLLRITLQEIDNDTGLPKGTSQIIRHFWLREEGKVMVTDYAERGRDSKGNELSDEVVKRQLLDIPRIPFVLLSLNSALMKNVAQYQIGLLNLASSDLNYVFRGNYPFYTEQYDAVTDQIYNKGPTKDAATGTESKTSGGKEVAAGSVTGRRYPKGVERPGFIAPPAEPLKASMEKQEQMKREIRELLNLGMMNTKSTHASAESKGMDDRSVESGLSAIGQELEWGEKEIAKIWAMYENTPNSPADVKYPQKYQLKTQKDKEESATSLKGLKGAAPSVTFNKEVGKKIAEVLFDGELDDDVLDKIKDEVDKATFVTSDAVEIASDVELGLVSAETASTARGYDGKKEVPLAQKEKADRLAIMAISQSKAGGAGAARGVPDAGGNAKDEKVLAGNTDTNPTKGQPQ